MLTVENTGEKLTPQFVSTLVEPFRRGTERIRTNHAGVGLGLAIVNSITQAHDGALTLTPRAAGGLRVRCNFRLRHRAPAEFAPLPATAPLATTLPATTRTICNAYRDDLPP